MLVGFPGYKVGDLVEIYTPENPRIHQAQGEITEITHWGAYVKLSETATGQFRALYSEMRSVEQANKNTYTGEVCPTCGSSRMRRNGTCLLCEDCGSTTGCS